MTHKDRILRHLKDYGSITHLECMKEYGTYRLSHYIWLLRNEGYTIDNEEIGFVNKYGEKGSYVRYHLKGDSNE